MNNIEPCLCHSLVNHLQFFSTPAFLLKVHFNVIHDHINAKSGGFLLFIMLDIFTTINAYKFTFPRVSWALNNWVTLGQIQHGNYIQKKQRSPQIFGKY